MPALQGRAKMQAAQGTERPASEGGPYESGFHRRNESGGDFAGAG